MNAREWAAVAAGGTLGALLRVLVGEWSDWGTLIANILGSALVGWYVASRLSGTPVRDRFFVDGFCGGFTTFAVFSVEVLVLADTPFLAVGYATLMGASALAAAAVGWRLGSKK